LRVKIKFRREELKAEEIAKSLSLNNIPSPIKEEVV
jgi:hypothetical protein